MQVPQQAPCMDKPPCLPSGGGAAVSGKVSVEHEWCGHWGSVGKAKSSGHHVNECFLGNGDCPSRAIMLD